MAVITCIVLEALTIEQFEYAIQCTPTKLSDFLRFK